MCSLCFNACLTAGCEGQVLSSVFCLCMFLCLAAGLDDHIHARLYFSRTYVRSVFSFFDPWAVSVVAYVYNI